MTSRYRLIDWTSRLLRHGKTRVSADVAFLLDRLGTNGDTWSITLKRLFSRTKTKGVAFSFLAASSQPLRTKHHRHTQTEHNDSAQHFQSTSFLLLQLAMRHRAYNDHQQDGIIQHVCDVIQRQIAVIGPCGKLLHRQDLRVKRWGRKKEGKKKEEEGKKEKDRQRREKDRQCNPSFFPKMGVAVEPQWALS